MSGPSLFTMEWWLTVVVLSVALNLVAAYLKPRLDKVGGRISTRWAQANARRAEKREARIEWASRSDMNYITHRFRAIQARLTGVGSMFFAVIFTLGGALAPRDKLPGVNLPLGDSAALVGGTSGCCWATSKGSTRSACVCSIRRRFETFNDRWRSAERGS